MEWNPPTSRPLLRDVIRWPENLRHCSIRTIIIPPDNVVNAIVAVNCGIRRARGQFILPSAIDLLYSDELMVHIASRSLSNEVKYRIDRCDVNREVVRLGTLREQLDYCRENVIKTNGRLPGIVQRILYRGLPKLHTNACGDFQLMARNQWHFLRGYCEDNHIVAHVDSLMSYASHVAGVKEAVFESPMHLYHIDHDFKFNDRIKRVGPYPRLERWLSSLWLSKKALILYYVLVEFMGGGIKSSVNGASVLDSSECRSICREIMSGRHSFILNGDDWGLGREQLEESIICVADWDKGEEGQGQCI